MGVGSRQAVGKGIAHDLLPIAYLPSTDADYAAILLGKGLNALMQDILRGRVFGAMPFFDQKEVIKLLDRLPSADEGARVAWDQPLMMLTSAAVLHDRYGLAA